MTRENDATLAAAEVRKQTEVVCMQLDSLGNRYLESPMVHETSYVLALTLIAMTQRALRLAALAASSEMGLAMDSKIKG